MRAGFSIVTHKFYTSFTYIQINLCTCMHTSNTLNKQYYEMITTSLVVSLYMVKGHYVCK